MRPLNRRPDELRPITIQRHFTTTSPGSVLIQAGGTLILCTASVEDVLPPWKMKPGVDPSTLSGWITAEYSMLPGSTSPRKRREREKMDGRSTEIQRLIGRSLRAAVDLAALGPRTLTIDCDVLQADGGTRTLSITGGFIALCDAIAARGALFPAERPVVVQSVAAVSVGILSGEVLLDLEYVEDSRAEVDLNVVMTGSGEFIEVQGTAEGKPFSRARLDDQLNRASAGIAQLSRKQYEALTSDGHSPAWPVNLALPAE